ncbi:phage tail sheath subtilisin-like domain-containing protein [Mesorhizobium sp. BR1-1-16]|uniref:phage tail sheath family protein n=1 Tax=Mesorhizobium sp. BR1-1-16 TaxID=2876653 RepID=UPI001CCBCDD6|nr:phage tail sheath subtilisin-like domain-containing protein [Mesorhizobium sp. BR1-1-16]MBZ9935652.1 phage tail sheath subtilisin-like domain-containing protein [Mesorhizobium sp. BR1-1-16]
MPVALLHPGVYIEEVPSGVRTITGVATSITLFIGWSSRGPTDRALRLTSFADFERLYGGLNADENAFLGYGVRQFYQNGGSDAYVLRIAADDADTATATLGDLTVSASSPGGWAGDFSVRIAFRPAPDDARFTLDVIQPGANNAVLESFANLSFDPADDRFAPNVINGRSAFIDDLVFATDPPAAPTAGTEALAGGDDGTVLAPDDADFTTPLAAAFAIGGIADRIDLFNIICVPGLTDVDAIGALQTNARERRAFLVVDCSPDAVVGDVGDLAPTITGADARNSAYFFPWVRAADPLRANAVRAFPPSGYVAGVMARTDATRGVWKAPAGTEASLNGALGLAITMSDAENGQLNPRGVNCLRTMPVYGNIVWGSRTLHGDDQRGSEWKYVPVRRMALFLEESLFRGTQWVVFEPNDEPLWAQIRLNIGAFMQGLFRQGAFQGATPRQAYFVKCDRETTTQADINLGIVNIHVGFAPLKPAEFVVLRIQQIAGDIAT